MFRFKKSVPVSYDRQGYIYFLSRLYDHLPADRQEKIRQHCRTTGGEHAKALFTFVTTDLNATAICARFFLSRSTLDRVVRKYYMDFPQDF